ncbi:hypothetical protein HU200_018842 [Digitaria exilis]|uniref:VQ domain-containing protein n=1 Tax=Digitaria exilis TaxID=1010633 RepID=A0A835KJ28_9POAL|nr:hypothetical protein HU200_018842 [Digitaria exilis]
MANPSHDRGGSPALPVRRSRTRRDPSRDEVYRVPPQDFAHTVQKLTGTSTTSQQAPSTASSSSISRSSLGLAAEASPPPPSIGPPAAPALLVSTPMSMQEAYLAWCASNNVLLSPGTMAEMDRGGHQS